MATGDCENAFCEAARRDGIVLTRYKMPWLNQQGHFGLPVQASHVIDPLHDIFLELGGDGITQAAKRRTPLPGDFFHPETRTIIEVDEVHHFTSFRLRSFDFYPTETPIGFDLGEYKDLCRRLAPKADSYRRTKTAPAFGMGGRQRQRAYYDALRDLSAPAIGLPPVLRVAAPDIDGSVAYSRYRDRIRGCLEDAGKML